MSPARTRKVTDARAQARAALGRPEDGESYDGLPPQGCPRILAIY